MTDLLEIPDFLKRDPKDDKAHVPPTGHRGSRIRLPDPPKYNTRPKVQKIDILAKRKGVKQSKPAHPTTLAIKRQLGKLAGDVRRDACYAIADENGVDPTKWDHLNNGHVAMTLTNVIRGLYYENEPVFIGGNVVDDDYLDEILGEQI